MKIRKDYVTNSSSSSFVGVFGEVTDLELVNELFKNNNFMILDGSEVLKGIRNKYSFFCDQNTGISYDLETDWAGVDIVPIESHIDENKKYIIWASYGGAGDSDECFLTSDYDFELDYNVDISDFDERDQKMYNDMNEKNGVKVLRRGYGAGRNG